MVGSWRLLRSPCPLMLRHFQPAAATCAVCSQWESAAAKPYHDPRRVNGSIRPLISIFWFVISPAPLQQLPHRSQGVSPIAEKRWWHHSSGLLHVIEGPSGFLCTISDAKQPIARSRQGRRTGGRGVQGRGGLRTCLSVACLLG